MDYEKYKNALEKAKIRYNEIKGTDCNEEKFLLELFPELAESKDEKIRKALVRFHKSTIDVDGIKGEDILAWLEKQGEQKPIWSEKDEEILKNLIDYFSLDDGLRLPTEETIDWLKSLKERLS